MTCSFVPKFRENWGNFRNESKDNDLALESERESTGLNQAEKFPFEYLSCFVGLITL